MGLVQSKGCRVVCSRCTFGRVAPVPRTEVHGLWMWLVGVASSLWLVACSLWLVAWLVTCGLYSSAKGSVKRWRERYFAAPTVEAGGGAVAGEAGGGEANCGDDSFPEAKQSAVTNPLHDMEDHEL